MSRLSLSSYSQVGREERGRISDTTVAFLPDNNTSDPRHVHSRLCVQNRRETTHGERHSHSNQKQHFTTSTSICTFAADLGSNLATHYTCLVSFIILFSVRQVLSLSLSLSLSLPPSLPLSLSLSLSNDGFLVITHHAHVHSGCCAHKLCMDGAAAATTDLPN